MDKYNRESDFTELKKDEKKYLKEETKGLYNLFGYIPEKYVKYFNFIVIEIVATIIFAFIYYILLLDFNRHFYIEREFRKEYYNKQKWITAIFMSVNFQSTTSYIDIKCKSLTVKTVINFQLILTIFIAFFFITV